MDNLHRVAECFLPVRQGKKDMPRQDIFLHYLEF